MRKKVFVDTNVIISGTFFNGNEAKLLSLVDVDLVTSDTVISEVKQVAIRKFASLRIENKKIALLELEHSLQDFNRIIECKEYLKNISEAKKLIKHKKDSEILAAVIEVNPDYFVTGDKHFHTEAVAEKVNVKYTKQVLDELLKIL
ncbi:putative toxin-antitoxin system toxin component, PIN family [bacterium]|nr:putative toxin-antitoxin system toxin component, PIN family [bacterium]